MIIGGDMEEVFFSAKFT